MGSFAVPAATTALGFGLNQLAGQPEQPGAPPQVTPPPQQQPQQQQMMQPQNDQFQILIQLLQRLGQGGGF